MEDTENEKWKYVIDHPEYQISTKGQFYSKKTNKIMKLSKRSGYLSVNFDGVTEKIHRMVANAFICNDDKNKCFVNHKDGNKLNNNIENLEWETPSANVKHAIDTGLIKITKRRVTQLDKETNEIVKIYESLKQATEETGINDAAICKVCKGQRQTAGGYSWVFTDKNPNENDIDLTDFEIVTGGSNYMINRNGDMYSIRFKKIMKQQTNADGYKTIQLNLNGDKKDMLVHRLVAKQFINNIDPENKVTVNHIDKNRTNNKVSNLEWATYSENRRHISQ